MQNQELNLNISYLLELYVNKKYDELSECFIAILSHFDNTTYLTLASKEESVINEFIDIFLFLFIKPDYILNSKYALHFIHFNGLISNLVAMSVYKTTDIQIALLKKYENNFFKILTLYSARNKIKFDPKLLFDVEHQYASMWYYNYFSLPSYPTGEMTDNIRGMINNIDERLCLIPHNLNASYFKSTYYDAENDKKIKKKINASIQDLFKITGIKINNTPDRKKIAIITEEWFPSHSIYRIYNEFIKKLKDDYELTLIHLGQERDDLDTDYFHNVINIQFIGNYELDLEPIANNDFMAAFYINIGTSLESIYLANLRIAPLQITGYGHPISTHGAEMDFFIGGSEVEDLSLADMNYSERLVLIPGIGVHPFWPNYEKKDNKKTINDFIINCCWTPYKYNYEMLGNLKQIIKKSDKKILFRFFPSCNLNRSNNFVPFCNDLKSILGANNVEIIPNLHYKDYMHFMEESDISLAPYPFGGYNTVIDSLYLAKPIVVLEGTKAYNRIHSAVLRRLNLDNLIAYNHEEYINKTVELINNDNYRINMINQIKNTDLNNKITDPDEPEYFKKAIDYLIGNYDELKTDKSRKPIIIT